MVWNFNQKVRALVSISVLSLVLVPTLVIKPDVAVAGDFSFTCDNLRGYEEEGRYYLEAICKDKDGDSAPTRLAISDYIANYDGNLAWAAPLGNFHNSCKDISVELDLYDIASVFATCGNGRGGWNPTTIFLDDKISNQNGVLAIDR